MQDDNLNQPEQTETQPEIIVNEYGATHDQAVVVEEADRTVLLTENETVVFEKQPQIDIVPKNRPRKVYGGMWGKAEIATFGVALLTILATLLFFIFLVIPAKRGVEQNRAERDKLERELASAKGKYDDSTTTEAKVAQLVSSVTDFETRFLPISANGRTSLYQRINGLIGAYGLVNTTGPDFAPLEIADGRSNQTSEGDSGKSKYQSIFPGVYVTMTLEGSYQNLRRFIREIETTNQFVVISAVELEPSETKQKEAERNQPQQVNSGAPNPATPVNPAFAGVAPIQPVAPQTTAPKTVRGKNHGELVSLRLEMAAYFRRPDFVPPAPETETVSQ